MAPSAELRAIATLGPFRSEVVDLHGRLAPGEELTLDLRLDGLDLRWYLEQGALIVSGVVVDQEGRPVAGAAIGGHWIRNLAGGADPLTQADGRFEALLVGIPGPECGDAPWDDVLCEVRKEGFGAQVVRATGADAATLADKEILDGVRITLRRGAVISGRVRTPEGEVVPDVTIEVADVPGEESPPTAGWERFHPDEQGEYRIPDLDAECGRYLYVHAEGRRPEWFPLRGRLVAGEEVVVDLVLVEAEE